jgi:cyanophycinase-like exopeptidase
MAIHFHSPRRLGLLAACLVSAPLALAIPIRAQTHTLVAQASSLLNQLQLPLRYYVAPDGSFSVQVAGMCPVERPGARCGYPNPQTAVKRGTHNGVPYQIITVTGGSYEVAFGVSAIEMAGRPNTPQAREAWMGNQVVSLRQRLEGRGARLVHRELVKVNGYQGIDLVWQGERHSSGASTTYTRLVAAGNRIYELTVGTTDRLAPALHQDARRFLNSFQILKVTG